MANLPAFTNPSLLQTALTHRSYLNEYSDATEHNERLEFLGDALLTFLSGEFLYQRFPDRPEGDLTPLRASLVDESQLAQFAIALHLPAQLRLGRGAEQEGGRTNPNLLSSAFEAVVGAYFLDGGSDIAPVRDFVRSLFEPVVHHPADKPASINYKSRFQEWALAQRGMNPCYEIINEFGPDHAREFTAEVRVGEQVYGTGQGRKKQEAQKRAAEDALRRLGIL